MVFLFHDPWLHIVNDISNPRTKTKFCIFFLLVPRRNGYKNSFLLKLTDTFSRRRTTVDGR